MGGILFNSISLAVYTPKKIFNRIRYVTAHFIKYQHQLLIPGLSLTLNSPSFSATLPRESLGVTR